MDSARKTSFKIPRSLYKVRKSFWINPRYIDLNAQEIDHWLGAQKGLMEPPLYVNLPRQHPTGGDQTALALLEIGDRYNSDESC